jgi:GDPmannose 4,6-dehydratase
MLVRLYRQEYGLFASNAILYNHESPLRKLEFVTRHVSNSVAEIFCGRREFLEIGNLDAFRDWGWAPDYVAGMILLSKSTKPGDFIFATGKKHSVGELVETAFQSLGIDNYKDFIRIKGSNVRKVDPGNLYGDPTNAVEHLGWKCTLDFYEIVKIMVQSDLQVLQTDGEYSWLSDSKFWD